MNDIFTKDLPEDVLVKIAQLYQSQELVAMEQYPGWLALSEPGSSITHFFLSNGDTLQAYAQILERFGLIAQIEFGPIAINNEMIVAAIKKIVAYYQETKFISVTIQLGMLVGSSSEYIENELNTTLKYSQYNNRENWSSISIDLSKSTDEIFNDFASRHKGSIKKAIKKELNVVPVDQNMLTEFTMQYCQMYRARGLAIDETSTSKSFQNIWKFFEEQNRGLFLGVLKDDQIIGGVIIAFQGNTARYYKGYSNPEHRHLPISPLALYEAMKIAKELGLAYFDLGGYNHNVNDNDPVAKINMFKRGFSKNYIYYPRKMYFKLKPLGYWLFTFARKTRNLFRSSGDLS